MVIFFSYDHASIQLLLSLHGSGLEQELFPFAVMALCNGFVEIILFLYSDGS